MPTGLKDLSLIDFKGGVSADSFNDITLFEPLNQKQILISDFADCLSVRAYLKMCDFSFTIEERLNAEYMLLPAASEKLPCIKFGPHILAGLDGLREYLRKMGRDLSSSLKELEKADMEAYIALVESVLGNAELYMCWVDEITYHDVTKFRYGHGYAWPLNNILAWKKRRQIMAQLDAKGWCEKNLHQVYEAVEECCKALSVRLGDDTYFFNERITELDAVVYGHLFVLQTTKLPHDNYLCFIVRKFKNLVDFSKKIDDFLIKTEARTAKNINRGI